ncbi:unnamed protein product [Linum tenue]|uniref:Uncharacterized protein n=1 Tax=Linum tenue TaxID=586396 RepID=A0AAV0J3Q6_9ROSI|nr:unnamed protein product [Linum tenue]
MHIKAHQIHTSNRENGVSVSSRGLVLNEEYSVMLCNVHLFSMMLRICCFPIRGSSFA